MILYDIYISYDIISVHYDMIPDMIPDGMIRIILVYENTRSMIRVLSELTHVKEGRRPGQDGSRRSRLGRRNCEPGCFLVKRICWSSI